MKDIRAQLPECPLAYEVPFIPADHTALVISIDAANIDWKEKMIPWTLASLINNTDVVIRGVHLYVVCDDGTLDRIRTTLKRFDLPEGTIAKDGDPKITGPGVYDFIYTYDINHWAFRDGKNQTKFPFGYKMKIEEASPSKPFALKAPCICDMKHATIEDFRNAIKHLMAAQLAMEI